MHTEICDRLGIEFPIFAFTHCRDVVAAVSKAGGFGVLGAVGFTPEQLEIELAWIDEHVGDHPYGVDIVIPGKYEGMGEVDPRSSPRCCARRSRTSTASFAKKLLADHGVPRLPEGERPVNELLGWTAATASPAGRRGAPPSEGAPDRERARHAAGRGDRRASTQSGRLVAALCGAAKQARAHQAAGVDIIIAQGSEGGGHTGEIGSVVLWPEVIDAVAPTPVLAAGGIGTGRQIAAALAMGAQGVWTGSIWLTVEEADAPPAQSDAYLAAGSRDTVRSRSFTGKPCRMLRNDWTEAWESPDSPEAARHAAAVHGDRRSRGARASLCRQGEGRHVQPGRPDRRPA